MKRKWNRVRRFIFKPYYQILHSYQRVTRGFSDSDMFSGDMFISSQIAGMLRWYINNGHTVSSSYSREDDLYCEDTDYMVAARNFEYTKYADLFEEYAKHGHALNDKWKRMFGGLTDDEVHDMMTWFGEHFTELWD